jgi:HSP20 family protein
MTAPHASQSPFTSITHLPDLVDELFRKGLYEAVSQSRIQSNLAETWEAYHLQVALPGVAVGTLRVQAVARKVMVGGTFAARAVETANYLRQELPCGEFTEVFELPGEIDGSQAEAQFSDGILTVRLPKVDYIRPTAIPIQPLLR